MSVTSQAIHSIAPPFDELVSFANFTNFAESRPRTVTCAPRSQAAADLGSEVTGSASDDYGLTIKRK